MPPLSCSRARERGAFLRLATVAGRSMLWMCLSGPAMTAGDCDVCPQPPETPTVPAIPAPPEAGVCDVCPKSTAAEDAAAAAVFRDCADCPGMVAVPAGDGAGAPARGFAMSVADISLDSWNSCVAAGPCPPADDAAPAATSDAASGSDAADARLYAAWLSGRTGRHYRLPTAAEWDRAVAAGVAERPLPGRATFRVTRELAP